MKKIIFTLVIFFVGNFVFADNDNGNNPYAPASVSNAAASSRYSNGLYGVQLKVLVGFK